MHWLSGYIKEIGNTAADGDATEFSYRTPIENMLQAAVAEFSIDVDILQEPSRIKNIGAPDFRLSAKGGGIIGYTECKKPGDNLQKLITKSQLEKYRALSSNILLTDSWRWLLLRDGKKIKDITLIEKLSAQTKADFTAMLRTFMEAEAEKIGDAKRLAEALARRCAILRKGLEAHETDDPTQSRLHGLLADFRTALDAGLSFAQFADTFAQTLVYSLLLAKLKAPVGATIDLYNINRHIPANFAVIRDVTIFSQELRDSQYEGIAWVVDDILAVVNTMDAAAVAESMSYTKAGNGGKGFDDADDPYIYFYENFLAAYDAKQRERRGVYYTPPPVVKFIVRAVDDLLRRDFDLANGLAETDTVTALDFAAGTGTFMLEMTRTVLAGAPPARRDMLTHDHILKNFYGFELLMAPYAIAHLKLSQFLLDNNVPLKNDERIKIFLTNTLERISKQIESPMIPKLAEDANHAQLIKDSKVLVICGNPPYSVVSQNKGELMVGLVEDYKYIDGEKLKESNLKVLLDDYVKFIRFAQWKMERVEHGIVAIITNHGFLDNPTFRGMRKSLIDTFDALYFLDLHGNANKKETAPDGGKDENVFDIRQGVAISLLVKNPNAKKKGIFHADLYGKRNDKYTACLEQDLETTQWKAITPASPFYLFIPRDQKAAEEYEEHYSVKDIFMTQSTGIKSHRDHFAFAFNAGEIKTRISKMIDASISTKNLREIYNLKDTQGWSLESVRKSLMSSYSFDKFLKPCLYRPFDIRWCYYGRETMDRHRPEVMRHMLAGANIGLVTVRQVAEEKFNHAVAVDKIMDTRMTLSNKGAGYLFPLYRYDTEMDKTVRVENLNPGFRKYIDDRYGKAHTPEDILGCIYAILHSPDYRNRYADFLRTDFPRIPFPADNPEFTRLALIGNALIAAHLLRNNCTGDLARHNGTGTSHKVKIPRYNDKMERLYFNKDEYFAPIPPEVFNFQIGGYQPLDKYLKSRKDRTLTLEETDTLQKTANAIAFTIKKMGEIGKIR